MERLLSPDYVEVMIDTERMIDGETVANELREGRQNGLPWMAILDGEGKTLVTGEAESGNIGCPVTKEEAAWFLEMIRRTATRLDEDGLAKLKAEHDAFAAPLRRR